MKIPESTWSENASTNTNPYQPPPMPFERVVGNLQKRPVWCLISIILQLATIVVGLVAAFVKIKSIIVSGAVLSILGIFVALMSVRHKWEEGYVLTAVFGASGPVISVICFLLINGFNWSPTDGREPIIAIVTTYSAIFLPLGLWTLFSRRLGNSPQTVYNSMNQTWMLEADAVSVQDAVDRRIGLDE